MPTNAPQQDSPQEAARRLENVVRMGTIANVRYENPPRCRVQLGENTTDWLPWIAGRAASIDGSHWWPPLGGEQCVVLSPGGDLSQGVVLLGIYSDLLTPPSDEKGVERTQWSKDDFSHWGEGAHTTRTKKEITLRVGDECHITLLPNSITMKVGKAVLTIGPDRITSNVDIVAENISAVHHLHGEVRTGNDTSGAPQ